MHMVDKDAPSGARSHTGPLGDRGDLKAASATRDLPHQDTTIKTTSHQS